MLFKRISRASAETIFMVVQNVSGGTVTADHNVVFDTGASADGVRVTQAATNTVQAYAGVADADIANNAFGLIQVYGFRSRVLVDTNTTALELGLPLEPFNASFALRGAGKSGSDSDSKHKAFAFSVAAVASSGSSSTSFQKAFIRAL